VIWIYARTRYRIITVYGDVGISHSHTCSRAQDAPQSRTLHWIQKIIDSKNPSIEGFFIILLQELSVSGVVLLLESHDV
jgi:G:T-mismatch repair DNA endonuclease (very short patch repair protein)